MKLLHVGRFEGHCSTEHSVEYDPQGPYVSKEALVSLVCNYLRRDIRRRAALLLDELMLLDDLRDAEVAQLDALVVVKQHVVEFNVAVQNAATVAVAQPIHHLLENVLGLLFGESLLLFHIVKQVACPSVLHHDKEML